MTDVANLSVLGNQNDRTNEDDQGGKRREKAQKEKSMGESLFINDW